MMSEDEARERLAEIAEEIGDCDGIECEDCPMLADERRAILASFPELKGAR
jgi:hypothetical protein